MSALSAEAALTYVRLTPRRHSHTTTYQHGAIPHKILDGDFWRGLHLFVFGGVIMNRELFNSGLLALGAKASEKQLVQFSDYSALLKEWNNKINLTAVTDDDGITIKHFLDSILPVFYVNIPDKTCVADIGTGAGFPGIPIKIMRSDIKLTLVDSLQKRVNFLNTVCSALGLDNTDCIHGRAEELGKNKKYREKYDIVVSRAVANLKTLCEYCLPFVKVGGLFVALKSENCDEELGAARAMTGTLGGKLECIVNAPLPESDITRKLIIIRKEKPTPPQFPRRQSRIKSDK